MRLMLQLVSYQPRQVWANSTVLVARWGGSMTPPQHGGIGEGNPVKRSHSSASLAEVRSTDLPQKHGQVNSSSWAATQETEGMCSAQTHVQPSMAQPSTHLLLCGPCLRTISPMGKALLVHCPVGLLEQEVESWGTSDFPRHQKHSRASQSQQSQEIARYCELRPALWSCLPGQGTWKAGRKALPELL